VLHACEIFFSEIVRARILAHPNKTHVSTAALFPRRKGRTDFLDFGAHIIGFKVPPFTHLGTVTCQSLLGMAILPQVRLADRWVKVWYGILVAGMGIVIEFHPHVERG